MIHSLILFTTLLAGLTDLASAAPKQLEIVVPGSTKPLDSATLAALGLNNQTASANHTIQVELTPEAAWDDWTDLERPQPSFESAAGKKEERQHDEENEKKEGT
jgi:hypothetical protein